MEEVLYRPPPLPPQPRPPDLAHRHHPPPWPPPPPPPPAAPCSVPLQQLQPLQPQQEPRPGAAQDQPPSMFSGPLTRVAVAPTQAFTQQPPTLPPVSAVPPAWLSATGADGAATRPAPLSGARQASPSVSPRGPCRPVPATPPKRPPAPPPRPVSAAARREASHAGGGAAPAAPPSPPRDGAPAPRERVRKVLHLFSGPANKKEGLKATIFDP